MVKIFRKFLGMQAEIFLDLSSAFQLGPFSSAQLIQLDRIKVTLIVYVAFWLKTYERARKKPKPPRNIAGFGWNQLPLLEF